jgi:transcriptional regulator with XRE-family HTH domain
MGLAKLRKEAGLSYHRLAEVSGVNYQKIWQIEHNVIKPANIALHTAEKLAKALKCEPRDLLTPDA